MEEREVFVHVHVPKCGGSTFREIIRRNFGGGYGSDYGLLADYQYTSQQVRKIIQSHPWLKCYGTHKVSLDLPFHLGDVRLRAITFIRNPVERFISHYFYHRNHTGADYVPAAKQLNLADYIDYALVQGNQPMYISGQTRFLTGSPDKSGLRRIKDLLNDGYLYMFPLGRFDVSCVMLERLYPDHFKDCAYVRRNLSRRDQPVMEDERQLISRFVGHDVELLQMAQAFLDDLIYEHFSDESKMGNALDDFHHRCARLRRINQIRSFLSRIGQNTRQSLKRLAAR